MFSTLYDTYFSFKMTSANLFQFGSVKILSSGKGLRNITATILLFVHVCSEFCKYIIMSWALLLPSHEKPIIQQFQVLITLQKNTLKKLGVFHSPVVEQCTVFWNTVLECFWNISAQFYCSECSIFGTLFLSSKK